MSGRAWRPGRRKIGLALGSGGARGIAHLGVIRALREAGIDADCVAGTSMGALVGLGLAADRIETLAEVTLHLDWRQTLRLFVEARIPKSGLIDGGKVTDFIRRHMRDWRIEELTIPYAAVATDLASGAEVVFRTGPAVEAIRASVSVPGLFTPVAWNGTLLVDGGLVNPVPVNVARALGADVVIAVDVSHFEPMSPALLRERKGTAGRRRKTGAPAEGGEAARRVREMMQRAGGRMREMAGRSFLAPVLQAVERWEREPGLFDVMGLGMRIVESQVAEMRFRVDKPDVLVRPAVGEVFFMEFHRAPEIEQAGYEAARAAMPEIRKACG